MKKIFCLVIILVLLVTILFIFCNKSKQMFTVGPTDSGGINQERPPTDQRIINDPTRQELRLIEKTNSRGVTYYESQVLLEYVPIFSSAFQGEINDLLGDRHSLVLFEMVNMVGQKNKIPREFDLMEQLIRDGEPN